MKASAKFKKKKQKKGDYSELRELRKIERKAKKQTFPKKISNTDQRTLTKSTRSHTYYTPKFFKN